MTPDPHSIDPTGPWADLKHARLLPAAAPTP